MLDGEAIDWAKEGVAESEVRDGMQRLAQIVGRGGKTTETTAAPTPEPPEPPPPPPPPRDRSDRFIGDFRLVRKLGEGGMGVVYEAEQQHPRRPVALKVIRGGTHVSPETLKLFQREAQTLAHLRHPGIAALYETGATEDGLHFFAMELVRGSTLTAWIGQRPAGPLTPHELKLRLSVFKKICDAVAYAHQKGVIHRDLKPANVLIPKPTAGSSMKDEVPDVKVLDFGLARITDSDVQATTYVTEMGQIRGTLPYMSPEQVRGNPDEIDLRTDVYSLGVMLYEMVTGALPYDLSKAQIPEAVRIICEQSPKSISASFTGTRNLDADIVTIAGKCLEKETSRRYQSAAALGDDIQRYLSDQPILARPPSAGYQFRKLAARHKGAVAFVATVFVLVTALAVTMTIQAFRISKERDRANQEAETAKQVSEFLEGLFKVSDPSEARGNEITAREILDIGADKIERELKDQPRMRSRLMGTMGNVFSGLGLYDQATALLEGSVRSLERLDEKNSLDYAKLLDALGRAVHERGEYERSRGLHTTALAINERLAGQDAVETALSLYFLGTVEGRLGRFDDAFPHLERALAIFERKAPDSKFVIWCLNDLGFWNQERNRPGDARPFYERALELRRRNLLPDDPDLFNGMNSTAWNLSALGELARARSLAEEGVAGAERVLPPGHPHLAIFFHTYASILAKQGDDRAALPVLQRALAIQQTGISADNLDVALTYRELAGVLGRLGDDAEAEVDWRRALSIYIRSLQPNHPDVVATRTGYAAFLRARGRAAEATRVEAGQ